MFLCLCVCVCVCVCSPSVRADAGYWDTEGCQTLPSPSFHTKCLCSQPSTFAVLAQWPLDKEIGPSRVPSVPLMVGCGISCTALLILLVFYAALWRFIRSERSVILLNFSLAILASNALILLGQSQSLGKALCSITAASLHFFFLSSFCWVLAEAWQSYLAVNSNRRTLLIRKRFLCLGWGLPAVVVAVSVGFTRARGYGSAKSCWLSLEGGLLYAFVGPAAVIVLVNMLIGIVIFNKLVSRDGISDKSKKQKAGASLWSSCVVLPLLALTWMSAVLAITDRSSVLFQVLFGILDALQGVVIISVHCVLRREVQDALCGGMDICKDNSENSPDSCKNGQTDFEKDVDLACQTVIFKEPSISGALFRISLDDEDDPKLARNKEMGMNLSSLPGYLAPFGGVIELGEPLKQGKVEQHHQQGAPVYLCTESGGGWVGGGAERDYMVLPGRMAGPQTPPLRGQGKPLNIGAGNPTFLAQAALRLAEGEVLYGCVSMDHLNQSHLNQSYRTLQPLPAHMLQLKPHSSVRHILSGSAHRTRTLPWKLGTAHTSLSVGSLERKRVQYSEMDFEKVMHTRKRHNELYHELNHSAHFHSNNPSASSLRREKRWSLSSIDGEKNSMSGKSTPDDQHPWNNIRTVTFDPSCDLSEKMDKLELNKTWELEPRTFLSSIRSAGPFSQTD
ncbi:hypothetical protein AAFF_G00431130 [Aldrovandia affinis]|uniref:G-protein coupled receptors family 2 profile 2 domain-containing protein n=1 Tax=Aldrovandia affinis TaxID=143900 RepID=A0AAD7WI97_9TELE|nr:hypothetical protein AAFF_G00431130 [Aldrovandia affinis]